MLRKYNRSGVKNHWDTEQLEKALVAVRGGELNINHDDKHYEVPYITISDHLKGKSKKCYDGPQLCWLLMERKKFTGAVKSFSSLGSP